MTMVTPQRRRLPAGAGHGRPFGRRRPAPLRYLRRCWRRLRSLVLRPQCAFVYDPLYEQGIPGVPQDPLRGEKVLRFLSREGLLRCGLVVRPRPASLRDVLRIHTPAYVESLQNAETLTRIFGLELSGPEAERAVDFQRLMAGGTIAALRTALRTGNVAVNLGGGFHHATPGAGMGFCVFNDVAIAIADARSRGFQRPVLVVDLDLHDGNGTRAIFAGDPGVYTYSIHGETWGDVQAVADTALALGSGVTDERYLGTLSATLPGVADAVRPGLVVYVAGTDPSADDPIGNWLISPAGLLARDRFVFEAFRGGRQRVPMAVVLSGGYGDETWRYSARSLAFLLSGRVIEPPPTEDIILERLHRIGDTLRATDFAADGDGGELAFRLSEEDLVGIDPSLPVKRRFLDVFSRHGVELLLERFGLLTRIRDKGFADLRVELEDDPAVGHTLRIRIDGGPPKAANLLVELRARRTALRDLPELEVLQIEWLLLQNPRESFTPRRPQLPGQQHPGLGLLREFLGWLTVVGEMLGLDGIVFTPSHYHVAVQSRRLVRFLYPEDEARMRACAEALDGLSLAEATRAVSEGRLRDRGTGRPLAWRGCPMALPVSERFKRMLFGEDYERRVQEARQGLGFSLSQTPQAATA